MAFTIAVANKILDKITRAVDFTPASGLYLALFTVDPGETGTAGEVAGGSYARQPITFEVSAAKHTQNTADVNFTGMPACTVTHVGLFSAASGGTMWWPAQLAAAKTTAAGDTLKIAAGDLDITLT